MHASQMEENQIFIEGKEKVGKEKKEEKIFHQLANSLPSLRRRSDRRLEINCVRTFVNEQIETENLLRSGEDSIVGTRYVVN